MQNYNIFLNYANFSIINKLIPQNEDRRQVGNNKRKRKEQPKRLELSLLVELTCNRNYFANQATIVS